MQRSICMSPLHPEINCKSFAIQANCRNDRISYTHKNSWEIPLRMTARASTPTQPHTNKVRKQFNDITKTNIPQQQQRTSRISEFSIFQRFKCSECMYIVLYIVGWLYLIGWWSLCARAQCYYTIDHILWRSMPILWAYLYFDLAQKVTLQFHARESHRRPCVCMCWVRNSTRNIFVDHIHTHIARARVRLCACLTRVKCDYLWSHCFTGWLPAWSGWVAVCLSLSSCLARHKLDASNANDRTIDDNDNDDASTIAPSSSCATANRKRGGNICAGLFWQWW